MTSAPLLDDATDARTALPEISVVVPTRDRPVLLRRAVARILDQDYAGPVEILVVFDQSEPAVVAIEPRPDRSVRLLRNERTPGLAGARNAGVLAASGDLVAFCDDDDEWLPEKLRRQVALLRDNPGTPVVACGIFVHYGDRVVQRMAPENPVTRRELLRDRIMEINPCTVLVDRSILLDRIGLVDEQLPGSYYEDYEWLLRAAEVAPIPSVGEPLTRVHWHTASFYAGRYQTILAALRYMLDKYPEFAEEPAGLARLEGQVAFAHAALGERPQARAWARRALRHSWREQRAYVALLISTGLVKPQSVVRVAHRFGRGI